MALQPCPAYYAGPERFIRNWARFSKGLPFDAPVSDKFIPFGDSLVAARNLCIEFMGINGPNVNPALDTLEKRRMALMRDFDENANARHYDPERRTAYTDSVRSYIKHHLDPKALNKALLEDYFDGSEPRRFIVSAIDMQYQAIDSMFHSLGMLNNENPIAGHTVAGPVPALNEVLVDIRCLTGVEESGNLDLNVWSDDIVNMVALARIPAAHGCYRIKISSPMWHYFRTSWRISRFPDPKRGELGQHGLVSLARGFTAMLTRRVFRSWRDSCKGKFMQDVIEAGYQRGHALF